MSMHSMPQTFSPGAHTQAPPRQAVPGVEQNVRHAPQLIADWERSAQNALLQSSPRPPQLHWPFSQTVPGGQKLHSAEEPGTQVPSVQVSEAAHDRPQLPQ